MLAQRLSRFLRRSKVGGRKFKSSFNNNQRDQSRDTCYNCKQRASLLIVISPKISPRRTTKKRKATTKKYHKNEKGFVAGTSWSDFENDSSNENEDQHANLCLMIKDESFTSSSRIDVVFDFTSGCGVEDFRIALRDLTIKFINI